MPENLQLLPSHSAGSTPGTNEADALAFSSSEFSSPELSSSEPRSPERRTFLALGAAACAATLLLRAGAAGAATLPYRDMQALRFLEEVEELQADLFTRASLSKTADMLEGRERDVLYTIARQDREQAVWFSLARNRYGVRKYGGFYMPNASQSRPPRFFRFPVSEFSERERLLALAIEIKETSVGAYHGMVARTDDPEMTQAIAALAGVEGRHAMALREINGQNPLPGTMETALNPAQVIERLGRYDFQGEAMK